MKDKKAVKIRRSYDTDFKQEVIRMLASGEVQKIFLRHLELPKNGTPSRLQRV